jgi:hypothetical protein
MRVRVCTGTIISYCLSVHPFIVLIYPVGGDLLLALVCHIRTLRAGDAEPRFDCVVAQVAVWGFGRVIGHEAVDECVSDEEV